jgi:hypothetical protein
MDSKKRATIVAGAVVALGAIAFWFFRSREPDRSTPAELGPPSAAQQATSDAGTGDAGTPLTAIAICRRMQSAGIVGSCEASPNASGAPFEGVAFSIPQGSSGGMLVQAHDAVTYGRLVQNITTGYILRFEGPRVVVQIDNDTPPDVRGKIKPLLDGLFGQ